MGRKFELRPHYYDTDWKLYSKNHIVIQPGLTVLVGCNGAGKTTLIRQMKESLDKEDIPYLSFNNLLDGGNTARQKALMSDDINLLAQLTLSSEGENIFLNISAITPQIVRYMRSRKPGEEAWLFFDGVDSGMSIDSICEIKHDLFDTIFELENNKDVYIVVSANAYEFASGEHCYDVYAGEYRTFDDYNDYKRFILKSRERKNKRFPSKEENP